MNQLNHLAIIMDGNGRWAKRRSKLRSSGHEAGAKSLEEIAIFCAKKEIKFLTLYAFSTENWKRPKSEVDFLMNLLSKFLKSKAKMCKENNIKFNVIGDISAFSTDLQEQISKLKFNTQSNSGLNLNLALNYGSRNEIVRAVNLALENGEKISENTINSHLDTANFGDIDLLIRTGGEQRLSNFLLWQASYAELVFTPTLWPDFTPNELEQIIQNYQNIHRKFGGL